MENTTFFAQLIGLFSLVMGLSMVLRRTMVTGIFHELSRERALSYVMGVLMLLMGLLLLLSRGAWQETIAPFISVLGAVVVAEALGFLFLSKRAIARYLDLMQNTKLYFLVALVYLALGGYLVWVGFWGS